MKYYANVRVATGRSGSTTYYTKVGAVFLDEEDKFISIKLDVIPMKFVNIDTELEIVGRYPDMQLDDIFQHTKHKEVYTGDSEVGELTTNDMGDPIIKIYKRLIPLAKADAEFPCKWLSTSKPFRKHYERDDDYDEKSGRTWNSNFLKSREADAFIYGP